MESIATGPLLSARLRAAGTAVAVAVSGVAVGALLVVAGAGFLRVLGADPGIVGRLLLAVGLSQAGFAATAVGYVRYSNRGPGYLRARLPSRRDAVWIVGGYVLALGAAAGGVALAMATGAPTASNQAAAMGLEEPAILLWLVPASLLVIGPGEEILFRGVVQSRLREVYPAWVAVGGASALFAGLHVVALTGGLSGRAVSVGLLFLPSLVLGVAYERTRNLLVSAVVHGAYDATLFGLLYVAVTVGPPPA